MGPRITRHIDSINQTSKMLSGKYLSEEMTLATAHYIRNRDRINSPGLLSLPHQPHPSLLTFSHSVELTLLRTHSEWPGSSFHQPRNDWCSFPLTFSGCLVYSYPPLKFYFMLPFLGEADFICPHGFLLAPPPVLSESFVFAPEN